MTETLQDRHTKMKEMNKLIEQAHFESTREALLEHARMGRSVCEAGPNGTVVWIEPKEIFARYGLDEFGRPTA